LNRYVAAYCEENNDDLVTPVARDGDIPAYKAVDACWAAFDLLHEDLDGGQTKRPDSSRGFELVCASGASEMGCGEPR